MLERVQKILANAGIASRRKCEELIRQGSVKVNGRIIEIGTKANPEKDKITIDDGPVKIERKVYIALNKPRSYVTTVSEQFGAKTVMDLINLKERVYPIGRLDKDAEGLLLFTNDGYLANKLTHPRYQITKTYLIETTAPIKFDAIKRLRQGMTVEGRIVKIHDIKLLAKNKVEIKIHEGRHKIAKRLFDILGYRVKTLIRMQVDGVKLGDLKRGSYRFLNNNEIESLRRA